jgi:hypothetical protein
MWDKINVFKYQEIVRALEIKDDIDKACKLISIIFDKTIMEVESMSLETFLTYSNQLSFLKENIGGKPQKIIKCNGKRYAFVWNVKQLPAARYIEVKHFGVNMIDNLHSLFASMVIPMKRKWYGWVYEKYDASKHEVYANDILSANIQEVYSSVVFFYHVYRNWIEVSQDYLNTRKDKNKLKEVVTLLKFMDGSITPRLLPTTKILKLKKRMNSLQSNI